MVAQTGEPALIELLVDLFDEGELRRFVEMDPETADLAMELPGVSSMMELAHSFVALARRRGLLYDEFFSRLERVRPHQRGRIEAVRQQIGGRAVGHFDGTGESLTTMAGRTGSRWFSVRLRLGKLRIVVALAVVGLVPIGVYAALGRVLPEARRLAPTDAEDPAADATFPSPVRRPERAPAGEPREVTDGDVRPGLQSVPRRAPGGRREVTEGGPGPVDAPNFANALKNAFETRRPN